MPVIPSTREAEAGESLEPSRQGCGEPRLHHCAPVWATRVRLCLKKRKKKLRKKERENKEISHRIRAHLGLQISSKGPEYKHNSYNSIIKRQANKNEQKFEFLPKKQYR